MIREFIRDRSGSYMIATAIALLPVMGAVALAVDFSEMNRHRNATLHALDASGIATARQIIAGASDAEAVAYAKEFFEANLGPVNPKNTTLSVALPTSSEGGGLLKMSAKLKYKPHFLPAFHYLLRSGKGDGTEELDLAARSEIRLKNTAEVALVLDNSGSMSERGFGSSQKRIDLLKAAAKQLVEELASQAARIQKVAKPVQFAVVPFSATVNVGPANSNATWLDQNGVSPIHHENFDWTTLSGGASKSGGVWYDSSHNKLTRWRLYDEMKYVTGWIPGQTEQQCVRWKTKKNGKKTCKKWDDVEITPATPKTSKLVNWAGCVEARPYPYNINDTAPSSGTPATLFVPTFAPDEPGDVEPYSGWGAQNNWWNDNSNSSSGAVRQRNMQKYFIPLDDSRPSISDNLGPSYSCTTTPITALRDVTKTDQKQVVLDAIDSMSPTGYTNVPEGIAWGWRTVSSAQPFAEGRPENQKGNDKVIIVLTDGRNTYEDLGSTDPAGNKSKYAAYGYTGKGYDGGSTTRMFLGTSSKVGKYDYSSGNYTDALDENMEKVCENAKNDKILVFTVALDLNPSSDASMITALSDCASDSRMRRGHKLFWNAKGSDLKEVFREIAEELSNLRIVA